MLSRLSPFSHLRQFQRSTNMQETILSPAVETEAEDPNWSDVIRLHELPSMPAVAIRLVQSFADPDAPISEIVSLLESDPALAVKIVHAANTPRYRVGRRDELVGAVPKRPRRRGHS